MFHRIKSEPQGTVKTEDIPNPKTREDLDTEYTTRAKTAVHTDEDRSPIQRYAEQQASLKAKQSQEKQAEEAPEQTPPTPTQTLNEPPKEEAKTMTSPTENTEEQTQEEQKPEETAAYRAPGSVTGGYPGSYAGSAYTAPTAPAAVTESTTSAAAASYKEDGGRLVIGSGITMSGEIEACPHLVVEGTVEASLRGAEILEVSPGGIFFGTVEIAEATISGRFEGDITVTGRLTVTQTGQVTGSITYGELQMESGATIDGKLTPMKTRPAAAAAKPAKATVAPKAARTAAEASNDAQLFPNEAVAAAE